MIKRVDKILIHQMDLQTLMNQETQILKNQRRRMFSKVAAQVTLVEIDKAEGHQVIIVVLAIKVDKDLLLNIKPDMTIGKNLNLHFENSVHLAMVIAQQK